MPTFNSFFKNSAHQSEYGRNGYLILPLLDKLGVAEALSIWEMEKEKLPFLNGIHITTEFLNFEERADIQNQIQALLKKYLDVFFHDYKLFLGSFIVKEGQSASNAVPFHQDWTFVSETNGFSSCTLWVALTDTLIENGAMAVVPSSHLIHQMPRVVPSDIFPNLACSDTLQLASNLKYLPIKAGEAIFWNHATIHASPPNTSEGRRMNISAGLTHANTEFEMHYLMPNEQNIGIFRLSAGEVEKINSSYISQKYQSGQGLTGAAPIATYPVLKNFQADTRLWKRVRKWVKKLFYTKNVEVSGIFHNQKN